LLQEAIDLTLQNDTLPEYSDSLIALLSNEDDYYSKMLLISYYDRIGIYDMASQALTEFEALITELPEMQQVQLLQYITLQEILSEIRLNPDSLTSVVNSNLTFLEIEAGSRNPYTYIGAQLLLEQAGIRDYPERILLPFEPAISKDLSIEGTVIENPDCGGMPVVGLTLLLLDESLQPVVDVSPAVTDSSGGFKFDYFNIKNLNNTDYYYIMPEQCFTLQSNPLRTLAEWKFDDNIVLTLADVNRYWVKTYSETDSLYNIGTAIDMNGNIYVAGTTKTLATEYDYAVIKYSPTGEQLWAIKYAGEGSDWVSDMVVDNGGNCYVTGWSQNSDGDYDYLTVKYNISGVEQWTARYNGAASIDNYDIANSIAVDGNGNVYVTGASIGINIGKDILTIKYNNIGEQIWVKEYDSGYANDIGSVVKVDNAGNIIVAGTTYNINGNADYKFIKYAPDGSQICTGTYNYGSHDMLQAMTLDNKGNIIVTGASMSASYDYATVKFDLSGNILWIKRYGSAITDYPYDIASDDLGNIYVTGTCNNDYVTIKYDVDGIQQWASAYYYGANYIDVANAIDIDYKGNVYVTGMSWPATLKSGEIVTVKYSPYGIQEWSDTYYYVTNTRINQGNDIVVSQNNNVYITGYAWNGNNIDIITIKYSECFTTAHLKAGYSDISNPDIIINNESEKNISVKPPESYFYIFPNPNDGNMQLEYSFASGYDGKLIVRNLQGVEVDNYYLSGKSNRAWINTGNMPNGIYFYTLYEGSQKIKIGKIIIVK
ncbi:MAG: SBBP repeat-containing protein, partial [Bacteroidia bacterium]|nr:SBBP repeat-containing protein [Bacteroidia bacterium]